ncbi:hypothetical protein [Peribacillus simplex]|nr:hypothetical protein [Peribacillus simplex]
MEGSFLSKSIKVVVFLAEDGEYALPIESVFPSKNLMPCFPGFLATR